MSAGRASLCRGSGLLDQVISLFGRADRVVFFDCRSEEIRTVPFPPSLALIIARSGKKRDLASSHYNLRREQTHAATQLLGVPALRDATLARLRQSELPDLLKRRALHVIEENERVWCGVDLLQDGNSAGFGELMNASQRVPVAISRTARQSSIFWFQSHNNCPAYSVLA